MSSYSEEYLNDNLLLANEPAKVTIICGKNYYTTDKFTSNGLAKLAHLIGWMDRNHKSSHHVGGSTVSDIMDN